MHRTKFVVKLILDLICVAVFIVIAPIVLCLCPEDR